MGKNLSIIGQGLLRIRESHDYDHADAWNQLLYNYIIYTMMT